MCTKVTVVTVTYNAAESLEKTILSVLQQNYSNVEYIIIDGGSTDGSVEIIKKYSDKIAYWVSEPDRGIYDAMNKGIRKATGEWINFMNAGDLFFHESTLSSVFSKQNHSLYDILYSDVMCVYPGGLYRSQETEDLSNLNKHMPFCHQTAFVRTNLLKENPFDTTFKIAADYKFFYHALQTGKKFYKLPCFHAIYSMDGISSSQILWDEYKRINGLNLNTFQKIRLYVNLKMPMFMKKIVVLLKMRDSITTLDKEYKRFEQYLSSYK